jgi:pimeloyl-ACP methyl ester carboxylesterase
VKIAANGVGIHHRLEGPAGAPVVNLTERPGAIAGPALVLVGEHDPGTTPALARLIHDRILDSKLIVLPGARHGSAVEAATAFNDALLAFLGGVP